MYRLAFRLIVLRSHFMAERDGGGEGEGRGALDEARVFISYNFFHPPSPPPSELTTSIHSAKCSFAEILVLSTHSVMGNDLRSR